MSAASSTRQRKTRTQQRRPVSKHLENPAIHGRGWQTPSKKRTNQRGYLLERHSINFAGSKGTWRTVDARVVVAFGALIILALIVLAIIVANV